MGAGWGAIAGGISDIGKTVANAVLTRQMMKWQEKMRDTAYQATVRDLDKAGLNRALAFGATGVHPASTPGASSANIASGGSSIESGARAGQLIKQSFDQAKAVRFEAERAEAEASSAWTAAENANRFKTAEINLMDSQSLRNFEDAKWTVSRDKLTGAQERETKEREISTRVNRMLGESELPGARAKERFDQTEFGGTMREFRRLMESVPGGPRGYFRSNSRY